MGTGGFLTLGHQRILVYRACQIIDLFATFAYAHFATAPYCVPCSPHSRVSTPEHRLAHSKLHNEYKLYAIIKFTYLYSRLSNQRFVRSLRFRLGRNGGYSKPALRNLLALASAKPTPLRRCVYFLGKALVRLVSLD